MQMTTNAMPIAAWQWAAVGGGQVAGTGTATGTGIGIGTGARAGSQQF